MLGVHCERKRCNYAHAQVGRTSDENNKSLKKYPSPLLAAYPSCYYTSLFTKHMVAITKTKNEYYKGLQTHKKAITLTASSNYLVFTREKFITAFFNQLAW